MTHDINRAIEQGAKDAKAAERAKKRGARAGRGGRSKSGFSRSAGRAAIGKMKIRGRGISIESHENGANFKNRVDYANKPGKNAELIYANSDLRSMLAAAKLRPDIELPVGHISMSLPPRAGKYTKEQWLELIETARGALGLDDSYPMQIWRHNDTPGRDHLHIVFSRASVTGKCHDAQNIKYKCAAIERILEDKHGLKLVPPSEFKNQNSKVTKNEIEMALRTHQKPPRLQIADALKIAITGRPTVQQFVERLNAADIGVKANISKTTGKMSGFSFVYEGVPFKASQIGKEYGWKQLSERIDYEQARDGNFISGLDGKTGTTGADVARTAAVIDALDTAAARVSPAAAEPRTDRAGSAPAISRTSELPGRPKQAQTRAIDQAKPAAQTATIRGFARTEILDRGMRGWVESLHNRFARARVLSDQKRAEHVALFDSKRDVISAVATAEGYSISDPRKITDEQISALLQDLGGDKSAVEIKGNPDFCERVEAVAKANNLQIKHEFQVTATDKKAAEKRWEQKQKDDAKAGPAFEAPVFAPK